MARHGIRAAVGPAAASGRLPTRRTFLATAAAAVGLSAKMPGRLRAAGAPQLLLPPLLARPTGSSILVHARNGQDAVHAHLEMFLSRTGTRAQRTEPLSVAPGEFLRWNVGGLTPGTRYQYQIWLAGSAGAPAVAARGGFITQRGADEPFTAVLMTDPHTGTFADDSNEVRVMDDVIANVARDNPDFVIGLGDNVAWPSSRDEAQTSSDLVEAAYGQYRRHMGPLTAYASHFSLIGNWEGESGKFPPESVALVRAARQRFLPNPDDRTYPEGGSAGEDYYAFRWGPALFIVLNVQSYTVASTGLTLPTADDVTKVEDWTLGSAQRSWLERTLTASDAPFNFLCVHHTVGGKAGNEHDTLYGRGGARAADVGEQAHVHQLMRDHGVQIFFYGHDHVFVDDVVDGIHYTLPGSFGAPWHFEPAITGYARSWPDSGHARLNVTPTKARVEFIGRAGSVFYSFDVVPR